MWLLRAVVLVGLGMGEMEEMEREVTDGDIALLTANGMVTYAGNDA